jgi:hypothetical protein
MRFLSSIMSDTTPKVIQTPEIDLGSARAPKALGALRDSIVAAEPHLIPEQVTSNMFTLHHLGAVLDGCRQFIKSQGGIDMYAGKNDIAWSYPAVASQVEAALETGEPLKLPKPAAGELKQAA